VIVRDLRFVLVNDRRHYWGICRTFGRRRCPCTRAYPTRCEVSLLRPEASKRPLLGRTRRSRPSLQAHLENSPASRAPQIGFPVKGPRLALKSIFPAAQAKLLTPMGYLQCACRQGVMAETEERPCHFLRATPRSFSSSRPRGCRAGICEIAVNARSGSELDHARSARTPGIA
jgi:hypothetical protein